MKYYRKGLVLLLCLLILCSLCAQSFAYGYLDPDKETSLTLQFAYDGTGIPNTTFRLYRFAEVSETAHYSLVAPFSQYPIQVEDQTAEGWKAMAQTLKGYVAADQIPYDAIGTTDAQGQKVFSKLKTGLYFVMAEKTSYDGYVYSIEPTIVALPNLENEAWIYDVTILPKSTREEEPEPLTEIKVVKAWEDKGAESKRPEEITVRLMKDDQVYDTVQLNSGNRWRYVWKDLPQVDENKMPIEWSVAERPVKNYDVRIEREGNVFVVVNRYDGPKTPNTPLPQTGQLWWPVPVLAFLGLCSIAVGALISRRKNEE